MEDSDPVVEETPIFVVQPPNKQQIHLYSFPLRSSYREEPSPDSITYYPHSNELSFQEQIIVDSSIEDEQQEMSELEMIGTQQISATETSSYALASFKDGNLLFEPISELYSIKPDFGYINDGNPKLKEFEIDENKKIETIEELTGSEYEYKYVVIKPTEEELLEEPENREVFNIPSMAYKNLFITEQNILSKLSKELLEVKDNRRKCEILAENLKIFDHAEAKRLIGNISDQELLSCCNGMAHCIFGTFVVQSRFLVDKRLEFCRNLLLLMLSVGGYSKDDFRSWDVQELLQSALAARKQEIVIDRHYLELQTGLLCEEISELLDFKNLIIFKNENEIFGFELDYTFVEENLDQIIEQIVELQKLASEGEKEEALYSKELDIIRPE